MQRGLLFVLLTMCTATALAGEPTIVVMPDGTAWFSKGDGSPTIVVTNVVLPPGSIPTPPGPTPPGPQPPGPTPPNNPSSITGLVKGWSDEVGDSTGCAIMETLYKVLADNTANGTIPTDPASMDKAITEAADEAIDMIPGKYDDDWEEVHQKIMGELGKLLVQRGGTMTQTQWTSFFRESEAGFTASNANASLPIWLQPLIAELVKILIKLLTNMFAG